MELLKLENFKDENTSGMYPFVAKDILKKNIDYGYLNGRKKPSLLKPGAEKLRMAYGLSVRSIDCVAEVFDIEKKFIDITYKCTLVNADGDVVGICDGNANSEEQQFKYRYIATELKPSNELSDKLKRLGKGKWIKRSDGWKWYERIQNDNILGLKNNIKKIAQKRAFVGAVLMGTCTSELFSQE